MQQLPHQLRKRGFCCKSLLQSSAKKDLKSRIYETCSVGHTCYTPTLTNSMPWFALYELQQQLLQMPQHWLSGLEVDGLWSLPLARSINLARANSNLSYTDEPQLQTSHGTLPLQKLFYRIKNAHLRENGLILIKALQLKLL